MVGRGGSRTILRLRLEKRYEQNRFGYRGRCTGRGFACGAGAARAGGRPRPASGEELTSGLPGSRGRPSSRATLQEEQSPVTGCWQVAAAPLSVVPSAPAPVVYAPPPVYYAPEPVYADEPVCRLVRERYWDGYDWRFRRVQVCN